MFLVFVAPGCDTLHVHIPFAKSPPPLSPPLLLSTLYTYPTTNPPLLLATLYTRSFNTHPQLSSAISRQGNQFDALVRSVLPLDSQLQSAGFCGVAGFGAAAESALADALVQVGGGWDAVVSCVLGGGWVVEMLLLCVEMLLMCGEMLLLCG